MRSFSANGYVCDAWQTDGENLFVFFVFFLLLFVSAPLHLMRIIILLFAHVFFRVRSLLFEHIVLRIHFSRLNDYYLLDLELLLSCINACKVIDFCIVEMQWNASAPHAPKFNRICCRRHLLAYWFWICCAAYSNQGTIIQLAQPNGVDVVNRLDFIYTIFAKTWKVLLSARSYIHYEFAFLPFRLMFIFERRPICVVIIVITFVYILSI